MKKSQGQLEEVCGVEVYKRDLEGNTVRGVEAKPREGEAAYISRVTSFRVPSNLDDWNATSLQLLNFMIHDLHWTSFRVPSNLDDRNATSLQLLNFMIHDLHWYFNKVELIIKYGAHPTESRVIHRINTSLDLTRATYYELGLIVVVAQAYRQHL
nr:hypothetical protein [Tanacetum cinerariifolium]